MNVMEDLKAYLDGELSPARRTDVDAAMEQDERLRQELEEIRVLSRLIGDCVVEPEPVGLEQTLERLEKRRTKPFFVRLFKEPLRFGFVWAMGLFLLVAILLPQIQDIGRDSFAMKATSQKSMADGSRSISTTTLGLNGDGKIESSDASKTVGTGTATATGTGTATAGGAGAADGVSVRQGTESEVAGAHRPSYVGATPPSQFQARTGRIGLGSGPVVGALQDDNSPVDKSRVSGRGGVDNDLSYTLGMPANPTSPERNKNGAPGMRGGKKGLVVQGEMPSSGTDSYFTSDQTFANGQRGPASAKPTPLLVRTADVALRVPNVRQAQAEATNMAKRLNGFVEQSSGSSDENSMPAATLTLRIPEERFETAMNAVRALGKVIAESMDGQDVTGQVADTEARLKVMRASEISYIAMLSKAKKVDETLSIKDRLDEVRQSIESLEAQSKALRNQATYSTISVSLTEGTRPPPPPPKHPGWFATAWDGATTRASGLGRWFAEIGMNLLLLAPVWVPIVVGLWWLGRRSRR